MKFVDEAVITVEAGAGGNGALSFRREKYIPRGGPDGGDGGAGGSVHLAAEGGLNTLVDFRHTHRFRAPNGASGRGRNMSGRGGEDRTIAVPAGTLVFDDETGELIGDLDRAGRRICVARGGAGGLGNAHFKSSVNRAPRRTTPGREGEQRRLRLELQVLADVGLVGLPNAGKSTFLRAVSQARPKVADYPFTTLHPELGTVSVEAARSFVVADVPGLIAGAAEGVGLGIHFLKHLRRTRLLLHLVDVAPLGTDADPAADVRVIEGELAAFDAALARAERWLVINKIDLIEPGKREAEADALVEALGWAGRVYLVSAATGEGTERVCLDAMSWLESS